MSVSASRSVFLFLLYRDLTKTDIPYGGRHKGHDCCNPLQETTNFPGQSRFPGAGTQPVLRSWHNQGIEPQVGTSLPDLSADLSTSGFSQSSLLPQLIFCLQAYFFPLIPNPTRWQAFMRLTLNLF